MPTNVPLAAALAAFLAVPAPRQAELAFAPAEGLTLAKHVRFEVSTEMESVVMEMGGERQEPAPPDVSNGAVGELEVTDTYVAVDGGRVTELRRRFGDMRLNRFSSTPEEDTDEDLESPLAGLTVVFTWDEDGEHSVAFADEDAGADDDLLEELDPRLDFAELLPEGAVEEGDTWDAEPALRPLMSLGGELKFDEEEDSPQEELIGAAMEEELAGDVTCTFAGVREVDGRSVAAIEVEIDAEGEAWADHSDEVAELEVDVELEREARVEVVLEGELLWDVAGGHLRSLALEGDVTIAMDEQSVAYLDRGELEQRVVVTFEGEMAVSIEAERVE